MIQEEYIKDKLFNRTYNNIKKCNYDEKKYYDNPYEYTSPLKKYKDIFIPSTHTETTKTTETTDKRVIQLNKREKAIKANEDKIAARVTELDETEQYLTMRHLRLAKHEAEVTKREQDLKAEEERLKAEEKRLKAGWVVLGLAERIDEEAGEDLTEFGALI